jgi:hypothetical protein
MNVSNSVRDVGCRVVDDILLEDLEISQVKRLDLLFEEIRRARG